MAYLVCRILNCVILSDLRSKRGPNKLSKINRKPATNAAFIACARPQAIGPLDLLFSATFNVWGIFVFVCVFYVLRGIISEILNNFFYQFNFSLGRSNICKNY